MQSHCRPPPGAAAPLGEGKGGGPSVLVANSASTWGEGDQLWGGAFDYGGGVAVVPTEPRLGVGW